MNTKNIDKIITKYLNAESNLEEENLLKDWIDNHPDLPEEYSYLKNLFGYFDLEKVATTTPEFVNPSQIKNTSRKKVISMQWIGIAASILLLIGYFAFFNNSEKSLYPDDTFDDPAIAAVNAAEALELFAFQMNKGSEITRENVKDLEIISTYLNIFK